MDPTLLENEILGLLKQHTPSILSDEILEVVVAEEQLPDGTKEFTTTPVRGPVRLTEEGVRSMRPLARALAHAIIGHITTYARVDLVTGRIS